MNNKNHSYSDPSAAAAYVRYVESPDGQAERQLLATAIFSHLPLEKASFVLDAACGTGWLTNLLNEKYAHTEGCDSSAFLLDYARKKHPACIFKEADITAGLIAPPQLYDAIILSLATHDIKELRTAYGNLEQVLKPSGTLIVTTTNPYYSFPVGLWKRGILGKLFGKKPMLRLSPYNNFARNRREFFWKKDIPSYFHTFPETLNAALSNNLQLERVEELRLDNIDSKGRSWQLFLFPMLFLLVFRKRK